MAYHLTVKHAFGRYGIGARIDKPDEVDAVLSGPNEQSVLRINPPDVFTPPAPAPSPAPVPVSAEPHAE